MAKDGKSEGRRCRVEWRVDKEAVMADVNERDLVQRFVEDLTDYAIIVLDFSGTILSWNAGARLLLGYSAGEAVGRNFSELYSKVALVNSEAAASMRDAVQWGRHEATGQLVRRDGAKVEAHIVLRPLLDASKNLVGFGLIASEVARPKRAAAAAPPTAPTKVVPLRGNARILVVDDNQGVLEEAVDQLTSLGYRVVSASTGAEALALLERDDSVDLLFTDVVMPGELAGRTLAAKAMEMRPGLKVLFASGYFEGALVGKGQLESDVKFLAKPYRKKELAQKIEEVLGAAS
jgi:PAS domain S-box-containing protein